MENAARSTEYLTVKFEGQETLQMHELPGLDKQVRSIRGSLEEDMAKGSVGKMNQEGKE